MPPLTSFQSDPPLIRIEPYGTPLLVTGHDKNLNGVRVPVPDPIMASLSFLTSYIPDAHVHACIVTSTLFFHLPSCKHPSPYAHTDVSSSCILIFIGIKFHGLHGQQNMTKTTTMSQSHIRLHKHVDPTLVSSHPDLPTC
jgi:hypothetical protein